MADLLRAEFLEEAREEVARVVDQNINSAELRDRGIDRRLRILWTGDVEFDCQQAFVIAHCGRDLRSIAAGGDNGVAGAQGCLGDVDAQAPTSAGDEPNLLLSHGMILVWTTLASSASEAPHTRAAPSACPSAASVRSWPRRRARRRPLWRYLRGIGVV